jgi:hypothetical protein
MVQYVPHLREQYEIAKSLDQAARAEGKSAGEVDALFADNSRFKECYADYVFRKQQSRRFLVETNNLLVDIVPGEGSALEPFKLAHRGIDVLKVVEEQKKMALENERRLKLIREANNYGDPDIEKVTVVTATDKAGGKVNVSILDEGGGNP